MAQDNGGGASLLAYSARPQQAALHADETRFKVIVAHRRFTLAIRASNGRVAATARDSSIRLPAWPAA